jgi:hypothetical protein
MSYVQPVNEIVKVIMRCGGIGWPMQSICTMHSSHIASHLIIKERREAEREECAIFSTYDI